MRRPSGKSPNDIFAAARQSSVSVIDYSIILLVILLTLFSCVHNFFVNKCTVAGVGKFFVQRAAFENMLQPRAAHFHYKKGDLLGVE